MSPVTRDKVCPVMHLSGVQEFIDDENIPASMVSHQILFEFFLLRVIIIERRIELCL